VIKELPIALFGAVMGLVGLGLTARAAASLFPGVFRAPAYFTELWVLLGLIFFIVLAALYLIKLMRYPSAVREEFTNPVKIGFCGTLPVGMTLMAGGLAPYLPSIADLLWWSSAGLLLAFQVWALYRWISGGIDLGQVNAGWLIILVGGIVVPGSGIALGHVEASRFLFGVSAAATPLLMALLFFRAVLGPPMVEALRPSWFILLVPPSLIYANGAALFPELSFLENLYFFGLVLAAALLVYARRFWRWPFSAAWWAFTFPLDALAYAAARYAQEHPSPVWTALAGIALAAATLFVVLVLWKTLRSAASRAA
jgi:tellurite resistance protein